MSFDRSSLFHMPSLETTAGGARRFAYVAEHLPQETSVNIAFIDAESFDDRLAAIDVLRSSGVIPRPIISARRFLSEEGLRSFLQQAVQFRGVEEIFVVGGDLSKPRGPYSDSLDVINGPYFDEIDIRSVGMAGYPEGHPRIQSEVLWDCLQRKVNALKAKGLHVEITTQLSFDSSAVIAWIERVRRMDIEVPIRIGIPSPTSMAGILTFAKLCRINTSVDLLQRYGWKLTSLLDSTGPDRFLSDLLYSADRQDLGALRLHLYPMGDLRTALEWFQGWANKSHRPHGPHGHR